MWSKSVSRREFAEIVQTRRLGSTEGVRERDPSFGELFHDEIEVLWKFPPTELWALPTAVVIDDRNQVDFLAWVSTYLQSSRPITAYCRVLDRWSADEMLRKKHPPSLGRFLDISVGLILGEAASYLAGKRDLRSLSPQACFATLSYAVARSAALDIPAEMAAQLPDKWSRARSLVGSGPLLIPLSYLQQTWGVVAALSTGRGLSSGGELFDTSVSFPRWKSPHPVISDCCADILITGSLSERNWHELVRFVPEISTLRSELTGPREGRVELLERALQELGEGRIHDSHSATASFLIAYLASAIHPGSFDHLQLLVPLLPSFPDVILWYGLLAGLHSRVGTISGVNGLGRRIVRELMREDDILSIPSCDIAIGELEILATGARNGMAFNAASQSSITVEVLPCVNSMFRIGRAEDVTGVPTKEIANLWRGIDDEVERFQRGLDRLRRSSLGSTAEPKLDKRSKRGPKT